MGVQWGMQGKCRNVYETTHGGRKGWEGVGDEGKNDDTDYTMHGREERRRIVGNRGGKLGVYRDKNSYRN